MRQLLLVFLSGSLLFSACNSNSSSEGENKKERHEPKTEYEKVSYSIGILASSSIVMRIKNSGILELVKPERVVQGINDFVAGKSIEIEPQKAKENLNQFFRRLQESGVPTNMTEQEKDILSYSIGVDAIREVSGQLMQSKVDSVIDIRFVVEAMNHLILGEELFIKADDAEKIVTDFFQNAQRKKDEIALKQFEGNKISGEKYLEENKKRNGIKVSQSGLQLETIKAGTGAQVKMGDTIEVHYTGTFINGDKFDSSKDRNESFVFVADYNYPVISGWVEGAMLMKKGGKYKIYLPYELGYKDRLGMPIPPYSALIFEIEIISINEKQPSM